MIELQLVYVGILKIKWRKEMKVHVDYKPVTKNVSKLSSAIAKVGYDDSMDIVIEVCDKIHNTNKNILGDDYSVAELEDKASFFNHNVVVNPMENINNALKCIYSSAERCTKYEWVLSMRLFELSTDCVGFNEELIELIA